MKITHGKHIWRHSILPMLITQYSFDDTKKINDAQVELEGLITSRSDGSSHTWGYFPELDQDETDFPKTKVLADAFKTAVIETDETLKNLNLKTAFIRRATKEPESKFGGFHVDVSPGIAHKRDIKNADDYIMRTLFNLGDKARTLKYIEMTVDELGKRGINISNKKYESLEFPKDLTVSQVDIPPRRGSLIYGLRFISSLVPHYGKTTDEGHFLISFGSYVSKEKAIASFEK